MMYDGISMSVCTSYDYKKKENSNLLSEYYANVVLIIGIWCISHTHKTKSRENNTDTKNYKITVKYNKTITLASIDIPFKCSIKHDIACSEVPWLYFTCINTSCQISRVQTLHIKYRWFKHSISNVTCFITWCERSLVYALHVKYHGFDHFISNITCSNN
jgi:hypothetical protein